MKQLYTSATTTHFDAGLTVDIEVVVWRNEYISVNMKSGGREFATLFFHPAEDESVDALLGRVCKGFGTPTIEYINTDTRV